MYMRELDLAEQHYSRALQLNPNDVPTIAMHGNWLTRVGRLNEALEELDNLLRRDPFPPSWYWGCVYVAQMAARRYEETIATTKRMNHLFWWDRAYVAASYANLGKLEEARAEASEVLRLQPNFTASLLMRAEPFKDRRDAEPLLQGLRKAGLPE